MVDLHCKQPEGEGRRDWHCYSGSIECWASRSLGRDDANVIPSKELIGLSLARGVVGGKLLGSALGILNGGVVKNPW